MVNRENIIERIKRLLALAEDKGATEAKAVARQLAKRVRRERKAERRSRRTLAREASSP